MVALTGFLHSFAAVIAAGLLFIATAHAQVPRVDPAGLQAGEQYDRFIVQYRADAHVDTLDTARERVRRSTAGDPNDRPVVSHAIAPGGYVVRSARPMNAVEAEVWMRRLAVDSAVEYIE